MYSTPDLITALAARGLLPQADADRFRRLHEDAPADFGPRVLLKWLVNRGRLTVEQADKIATGAAGRTAAEALTRLLGETEDLQLASLEEDERDDIPLAGEPPPRPAAAVSSGAVGRDAGSAQVSASPASTSPKAKPPEDSVEERPSKPFAPPPDLVDDILRELPTSLRLPPKSKSMGWDTPLMLVGGGSLILLVLGATFLWWRLGRASGDDAFAAADEAYAKASYVTAVERFDKFLEKYPDHPAAGTAAVHRGLAKIRIDVETGGDWTRALATAEQVLPEIARQAEFPSARNELRALLPDIVDHLAKQSLEKSDATKLAAAREAKKLFDRYLADDPQAAQRGGELDDLLTLAERRLERGRRITAAAAAMRGAGEKLDAPAAFAARDALLAEFPDAATAPPIVEAAAGVAVAASRAVRYADETIEAAQDERAGPALERSTLVRYGSAAAGGNSAAGGGTDVAVVIGGGTAFALDAADGRLRWRRDVGFDGRFDPILFGEGADRRVLLDDSRHGELTAVDAATGRLAWRLPAAGADAWPIIAGNELLVTLREGRILTIDLATGRATGVTRFSEELVGGAVADSREQVRYQLARGGRLYVLDSHARVSHEAVYLGHSPGGIRHAPTVIGPYLVLVEDAEAGKKLSKGAAGSRVRLLKGDEAGRNVVECGSYVAADAISTPPAVARRLAAVVGERGDVAIFDFSRSDPAEAIKPIITRAGDDAGEFIRYAMLRGSDVWLSGPHLEHAAVESAVGKLTTRRTWTAEGPALQTPQWSVGRLVDVHDDGRGGLHVSAYEVESRDPVWQTRLCPPIAVGPHLSPDGKRVSIVAGDRLYEAPAEGTMPPVLEPTLDLSGRQDMLSAGCLSWPYSNDEQAYAKADADSAADPRHVTTFESLLVIGPPGRQPRDSVKILSEPASAPPVRFGDGMLVASVAGRVSLVADGMEKRLAEPFQPPLVAGTQIRWSNAAVVGSQVFIADRDAALYRLELEGGEPAKLVKKREAELPAPIDPTLVAAGELLWYAEPPRRIVARRTADLGIADQKLVDGALLWGPVVAGDIVVAAGEKAGLVQLYVWTTAGKFLRQTQIEPSAGRPLPPVAAADGPTVVTMLGDVLKIDPATAEISRRSNLGATVAVPPIAVGGKLVLVSSAGELLWLEKP